MGHVLNRTTLEYRRSVNDPDYPAEDWIHNPDLSAVTGIDRRWWVVDGDTVRVATDAEKNAQAASYRDERKSELRRAVNAYADGRGYDTATELRLKDLYDRALLADPPLANRAAYIGAALAWQQSVLALYLARVAALDAATTVAEIDAVTWDFSAFDASDPGATVTGALQVAD